MTRIVSAGKIEGLVGIKRHKTRHYGRVVPSEGKFYILHSQDCKYGIVDLRDCWFSVALDNSVNPHVWYGLENRPVILAINHLGILIPAESEL